ncbi:hypothetical protein BO71DRAFT_204687 [Aspergillus ellipticus CBS 707.79]|uniref:Uncharacterized protein n=1 Tax=Aspergillus ellipticus CBS 707.79 TaxID=1448320 RepID=A0A319DMW9_9EURO|nr:hypothetical protein BO71DRAFT_204687 [Aspergillus ellipticus CBS 707.79]
MGKYGKGRDDKENELSSKRPGQRRLIAGVVRSSSSRCSSAVVGMVCLEDWQMRVCLGAPLFFPLPWWRRDWAHREREREHEDWRDWGDGGRAGSRGSVSAREPDGQTNRRNDNLNDVGSCDPYLQMRKIMIPARTKTTDPAEVLFRVPALGLPLLLLLLFSLRFASFSFLLTHSFF